MPAKIATRPVGGSVELYVRRGLFNAASDIPRVGGKMNQGQERAARGKGIRQSELSAVHPENAGRRRVFRQKLIQNLNHLRSCSRLSLRLEHVLWSDYPSLTVAASRTRTPCSRVKAYREHRQLTIFLRNGRTSNLCANRTSLHGTEVDTISRTGLG